MPSDLSLSNRNETLLRQEFKRRYLTEFSSYVGGLMEESASHSANFLFLLATIAVGSVSIPAAALLGAGISARHSQVRAGVKEAQAEAAQRAADMLQTEDRKLSHVDAWLDRHLDDLPGYLDKLDRYEDERRQVVALIEKANRAGSADGLTQEHRALLKRHGVKRFKPPLQALWRLPPRCLLDNWHFSQLDRALWRDISTSAGPRGAMLRRMLGLNGGAPE